MATEYPVSGFRINAIHDHVFLTQVSEGIAATVNAAAEDFSTRDDAGASVRPSPSQWSPKEIIGHLIDSAGNNLQKIVRAQSAPTLHFPGYEQNAWVSAQRWNDREWMAVVALWRGANLHLAHVIAACPTEKLAAMVTVGADQPVTLSYIIEDYLGHMPR